MNVRSIQRALQSLGFDPGPIDGIWGRKTIAAVVAFQDSIGLPTTGVVDDRTEREILARAGSQPDNSRLVWYEEAQRLRGLKEVQGRGSNPTLIDWGRDMDLQYPSDDIPWCGLFVGHCIAATLPTEPLPNNPLGARNWQKFGKKTAPSPGAILVFWRESKSSGKGHVGFYESEDSDTYHVLGGNQNDMVNIARVPKARFLEARWPVSAMTLATGGAVVTPGTGAISQNEA
jgi:uncharacterized protein (TIGR02594 family)